MWIERQNHYRERRARFAVLRDHGVNEIVELLNGNRHVRPWGEYTEWIMSDLMDLLKIGRKSPRSPSWYLTVRPEIHVRDHVIVPDFAGWHRRIRCTHLRPLCDFSSERFVHAPDWICDIVEPTHTNLVRNLKPQVYLELGVSHLWLLDPLYHRLEVYAANSGTWQLTDCYEGRHPVRAAPLEHLKFELGRLWPNPVEFDAAELRALEAISIHLDRRLAAGVSEHSLLRQLVVDCEPLMAAGHSFFDGNQGQSLLRAVQLISHRVPITQALTLARLEIAAETEARKTITRAEAQRMSDERLSEELNKSIADVYAGRVISEEECLAQLAEADKAQEQAEREDSPLRRKQLAGLAAQFQKGGVAGEELLREALYGPDTRLIPFEQWPAIACEAAKRLTAPYHVAELTRLIGVLRRLYSDE